MSFDQAAIVGLLLVMLIAYATERLRVELVALVGLAAAFLLGLVPVQNVFAGFSSPAVVTVVEVLLVVAALSRTRVIDSFARRIVEHAQSERAVLAIVCGTGAFVSVFMNNIGALALLFPVGLSVCARLGIAPARLLMPLSFATLLGGMCSLTGTPANLVVNQWVIDETGRGLGYFELGIVGGPLAIIGLIWIVAMAPRTFARYSESSDPAEPSPLHLVAERVVSRGSALIGRRLPELDEQFGVHVHGVIRQGAHVFARRQDIVLAQDDVLVAEADLQLLDELEQAGNLTLANAASVAGERQEFVVMPDSLLLGSRIGSIPSFSEHAIRAIGLASRRGRIEGAFDDLQIGLGDVLVLTGRREDMRQIASECGLLPLSARRATRLTMRAGLGVAIFGLGVLATAVDLAPPEIAFGAVVLAMALMGSLNLRAALQEVNWNIILLLACMIPLGQAVEDTGAARVIANVIAEYLPTTDPLAVCITILLLAVATTPFIDNVSTAVVLSPIAAGLAARTGTPVEPVLMAVAIGASLDFLTPFGHHNNAVVMGAGGYRFADFPRFGWPLTALCLATAMAVLALILRG